MRSSQTFKPSRMRYQPDIDKFYKIFPNFHRDKDLNLLPEDVMESILKEYNFYSISSSTIKRSLYSVFNSRNIDELLNKLKHIGSIYAIACLEKIHGSDNQKEWYDRDNSFHFTTISIHDIINTNTIPPLCGFHNDEHIEKKC